MDILAQENAVEKFLAGDKDNDDLHLSPGDIASDDPIEFKQENTLSCENLENGCELDLPKIVKKIKHRTRYRKYSIINALKKRSIKCLNKMHAKETNHETPNTEETQPSSPCPSEQNPTIVQDETSNSSQQNGGGSQANGIDDDTKLVIDRDIKLEDDGNSSTHSSEKRKLDNDSDDPSFKKRLRSELEQNFLLRDKILNEYIDSAACTTVPQVEYHMEQVLAEIKMLNDLAREKEMEWNNIIHMKKIKEELLLRIQRRKQVMLLNSEKDTTSEQQSDMLKNLKTSNGLMIFSTNQGKKVQNNNKSQLNTFMELTNGYNSKLNPQRPVIDVQSIIADYRQRHPEAVPRRGRRIRSLLNSQGDNNAPSSSCITRSTEQGGIIKFSSLSLGSGAQVKHNLNSIDTGGEMSVLLSASELEHQDALHSSGKPPPPYSEVTVHPVIPMSTQSSNSSLLHGILTKTHSKTENTKSTYSPTLARLLTAPERSTSDSIQSHASSSSLSISDMLSNSKNVLQARNEITITPVGGQYDLTSKDKGNVVNDDEVEDTSDRLIIDESDSVEVRNGIEELVDEVPQCQGCNQKPAQFVCAGCGNQWYCSRECQVIAWDEHSEVCSG